MGRRWGWNCGKVIALAQFIVYLDLIILKCNGILIFKFYEKFWIVSHPLSNFLHLGVHLKKIKK